MVITTRYLTNVFIGSIVAFIGSILGISYTENTYEACQNAFVNVTFNNTCQEYVGWHTFSVAVMWISLVVMVSIISLAVYNHRHKRPQ